MLDILSLGKRKPTGEIKVFRRIAIERGMFSEVSGEPIQQLRPENFAHILPKAENKYPEAKLDPENIMIMTREEHYKWDNDRKSIEHIPIWQKVFKREAELLIKYKKNERLDNP